MSREEERNARSLESLAKSAKEVVKVLITLNHNFVDFATKISEAGELLNEIDNVLADNEPASPDAKESIGVIEDFEFNKIGGIEEIRKRSEDDYAAWRKSRGLPAVDTVWPIVGPPAPIENDSYVEGFAFCRKCGKLNCKCMQEVINKSNETINEDEPAMHSIETWMEIIGRWFKYEPFGITDELVSRSEFFDYMARYGTEVNPNESE